jgi:hypothetical protein
MPKPGSRPANRRVTGLTARVVKERMNVILVVAILMSP